MCDFVFLASASTEFVVVYWSNAKFPDNWLSINVMKIAVAELHESSDLLITFSSCYYTIHFCENLFIPTLNIFIYLFTYLLHVHTYIHTYIRVFCIAHINSIESLCINNRCRTNTTQHANTKYRSTINKTEKQHRLTDKATPYNRLSTHKIE